MTVSSRSARDKDEENDRATVGEKRGGRLVGAAEASEELAKWRRL